MEQLLAFARKKAEEASAICMAAYGSRLFTEKADKSPITETDRKVHDLLEAALLTTGIPVLSEEGLEVSAPYPERLWIIDPIDGTRGFINGTDDFAVMIGLLEEGRPVLGVLNLPATRTEYYAVKGSGAFMVREGVTSRLTVSARRVPELIGVQSVNHSAPYMEAVNRALEVAEILRIGSIGVKAGLVAESKGDYFLTLGHLGEWDVCAPEIIVTEAGGRVSDRSGDLLQYGRGTPRMMNGVVFSNGACHREVLTALSLALRSEN